MSNPSLSVLIAEYVNTIAENKTSTTFFLDGLVTFVSSRSTSPIMKSSVSRVMRRLKASGRINYSVVNNNRSEYLALPLVPQQ